LADLDLALNVLTISVSIIAVVTAYIDMRRRLKQDREASQSMAKLINTLREELELFRKQSKTSEDIERQKVLAKKEQLQWKQVVDVGKAIGWLLEYTEETEEEDEY
jgi:phage regulator Rha-like protein